MRRLFIFAAFLFVSTRGHALPISRTVKSTTPGGYIKVYVQPNQGNQSDILFVIDDSGSMDMYQSLLAANAPVLAQAVSEYGISTHAAVLPINLDSFGTNKAGQFVANLKNEEPDFANKLSAAMRVGVDGSGTEKPFEAVQLALSEPMLSSKNAGFLRDQVPLTLIFVTDAEDQSQITLDQFKSFLMGLKPADQLSIYAFMAPSADTVCMKDSQGPVVKLEALVNDMKGQIFKICDTDWHAPMQSISDKMVREITRAVKLPTEPVLKTIEVRYGSQKLTGGDLRRGWVYDESTNSVVVGDQFAFAGQPAGTELEVKFVPKYWQ